MKITWKNSKPKSGNKRSHYPNLPFDDDDDDTAAAAGHQSEKDKDRDKTLTIPPSTKSDLELADSFQFEGNKRAEDGRYQEALGKWEASLTLMPERAVLHEQKAQILLEIGDAWNALKAATRATELEPSWAEAWITLGRSQLNFGEPDVAIESFDRALAIKPDDKDAQDERQTAMHLLKKRKLLHSSGLSANDNRYVVGDTSKDS